MERRPVEIWRAGGPMPDLSPAVIQAIEAEGWDGQMLMDSQSLGPDPFALMSAWAAVTSRLKFSTGVTNPITRHPSVLANVAATVQELSGGRAVLGIGRGDSALAFLGRAPMKIAAFEAALQDIQRFLAGEEVSFERGQFEMEAKDLDSLDLGHRPKSSQLRWLSKRQPKVPMDVAVTGPRVIALAARIAERLTFSLGAIPERLAWGLAVAQKAEEGASFPKDAYRYGAQIIVLPHRDLAVAREWAAGMVATLARFQVIQGPAAGPTSSLDEQAFAALRSGYDMTRHDRDAKTDADALSGEFISRFAIVGDPDHCTQRMLELVDLGFDRFVVLGPGLNQNPMTESRALLVKEVLPQVRAGAQRKSTAA